MITSISNIIKIILDMITNIVIIKIKLILALYFIQNKIVCIKKNENFQI